MPGRFDPETGSAFTRMYMSDDMAAMNVRREHLAHIFHYKTNIKWMKDMAKSLGRPIDILDVGCGEANTVRMFYTADTSKKRDVISSYMGIDGDPAVIKRTEERAATVLKGINGTLQVWDITKTKKRLPGSDYDLIINNEVLEHIPPKHVPGVLVNFCVALRDDGLALISTPNKQGTNEKLPADHIYEWGFDELHEAIEAAGLMCERDLGVYIKKDRLFRELKEAGEPPDIIEWAEWVWSHYHLDLASMMTANLAPQVANNCIHLVTKQ